MTIPLRFLGTLLAVASTSFAEVKITVAHLADQQAAPGFKLPNVPVPVRGDAGSKASFTIVDGERDPNGGDVTQLKDGAMPGSADQPRSNLFFQAGTDGGRIVADLGSVIDVKHVNTYSWHREARGPQVYSLYASEGTAADFNGQPKRDIDPTKAGWTLIAKVDTRPDGKPTGGQYGVSITDDKGSLGKARYLLFDFNRTQDTDNFGNTFISEIDIIDRNAPEIVEVQLVEAVEIKGGYRFTVETTEAPDLTGWARTELIPVMQKWYPLIVDMLPSTDYSAPRNFSITFTDSYRGVAATMGNRIVCSPSWYRQNLKTEALGSLVHELVHVVQQYGRARRNGGSRPPGWLTEGIPDYIRWFLYEPESKGAEIKPANAARARHDASYRISANFINWVVGKYDKDLIKELNAAIREGRYSDDLWKERTGKALEDLAAEWKKALEGPATAAN